VPSQRARIFHFALYIGSFDDDGHSGDSRAGGGGPFAGRDLVLAYDVPIFDGDVSNIEEAGTLMHELGHNLGLSHGGSLQDAGVNYKPNYPSVMNYFWQTTGVAKSSNLALLDYSEGTLDSVDENSLDEHGGLGPDPFASDIAVKWRCPSSQRRGPLPSAFDVDWNCNGAIDAGSPAIDVNASSTLTVLRDHDDWSSLVYDGGGTLGGAGDPGAASAVTPVDEPDSAELKGASHDLHTVDLSGPGQLAIQSHTSAPVTITITNHHDDQRTYNLATTARGVQIGDVPTQITLAAQERRALAATLTANAPTDSAFFEVDAESGGIVDADSAITEVTVADQNVVDQPKPQTAHSADAGGLVAIDDSRAALRISVDGAHPRTFVAHAVGRVARTTPGTHVLRISEVVKASKNSHTRASAKVTTVRLRFAARQLQAVLVTRSRGKLQARVIKVAPGVRALLSLLPGTRQISIGGNAKARRVGHGKVVQVGSATTVRIGVRRRVKMTARAQLTVLVQQDGHVVGLVRSVA